MATLVASVSMKYATCKGTLDYTVTSTDTQYKVHINSFTRSPFATGQASFMTCNVHVTLGGQTVDLYPSSQYVTDLNFYSNHGSGQDTATYSIGVDVYVDRTHAAQTKALKLELTQVLYWRWDGSAWQFDDGTSGKTTSASTSISIAAKPSYAVTYNANGGSGAPSQQTKWYGENLALSGTKPTRTNYVFKRWNTNTADTGTAYNPGATYTGNAALALYAIWYAPYAVTYNANGGTGAPSAQTKVYNANLTLSTTKPTRTNYVFKHWNTKADGTGTAYNPGATYSTNANLTLYAIWYAPYTVTYDANGGTGAPSAQTKVYNSNLTLSSTKPTRASYVFKRWNTNTSDTGTAYNPGASYTANANLALHAIWNPIISYDANGGTGAPSAQVKTYGTNLTLQSGTPTRTGYTFAGWNTARDGSGTNYAAGGTYSSNAAATLYAKWTKNPEAPTISSLTVVRSNAGGNPSDDGTYCKVTAKWSVDTANVSGNTGAVTGFILPLGGSATVITFASGTSGTSGTATALVPNCDPDTQYLITVRVADTRTYTTRVAIMTRASFILDLRAGGHAMGIGSAAPPSGLEVGWEAQFDKAVSMLMGLTVGGDLAVTGNLTAPQLTVNGATSDVATSASGWTVSSQSAKTYGKVVVVSLALKPNTAVSAGSRTIATIASSYRPSVLVGFADSSGMGTISSGGSVTYRNVVDLATSSTVYVAAAYLKA